MNDAQIRKAVFLDLNGTLVTPLQVDRPGDYRSTSDRPNDGERPQARAETSDGIEAMTVGKQAWRLGER